MDLATQQILSGLTAGEPRESEGGAGGLTNFGNKVKEYWNTVKTDHEPLPQVQVSPVPLVVGSGSLRTIELV